MHGRIEEEEVLSTLVHRGGESGKDIRRGHEGQAGFERQRLEKNIF
jgi:hypothetical protein